MGCQEHTGGVLLFPVKKGEQPLFSSLLPVKRTSRTALQSLLMLLSELFPPSPIDSRSNLYHCCFRFLLCETVKHRRCFSHPTTDRLPSSWPRDHRTPPPLIFYRLEQSTHQDRRLTPRNRKRRAKLRCFFTPSVSSVSSIRRLLLLR